MLTKTEKEMQGTFCKELVENKFMVFEGARETYARIRGDIQTISQTSETTYGWEGVESVVLPESGEIPFIYIMNGANRFYRDEYVATPEGVYKTYSMYVVYK